MSDLPEPGIYPCTVKTHAGPEQHCCLWDGEQWLWLDSSMEWDPVGDSNCQVVAWELPMQHSDTVSRAVSDVARERHRQRGKLGWTESHDDKHTDGFLATLAAAKALCAADKNAGHFEIRRMLSSYFDAYGLVHERIYNGTIRQLLVESGGLIVAEIERIDRKQEEHEALMREGRLIENENRPRQGE